jgi:hypothetical protein
LGTSVKSSAPTLSTMVLPSNFANGSSIESEPAAMMTLVALSSTVAAVVLLHRDDVARLQLAETVVRVTLFALNSIAMPPVNCFTILSLRPIIVPTSIFGVLGADAVFAEQVREVPELARGIEQRLGRNATHAQAGAAERRLAVLAERGVDARGLQAQLRGADGGVVTGGAGTDDDTSKVCCSDIVFSLVIGSFPRGLGTRVNSGAAGLAPRALPRVGGGD